MPNITPWIWFDTEAEDAAELYTSIFPNSRITDVRRYGEAGPREAGTVMTVTFELDGQEFVGLNGGPEHNTHSPAVSFMVTCESQQEVDDYWTKLVDGGREIACGWVTDRFGISWQVIPKCLSGLLGGENAQRVMQAMLQMKKIEIAELERAAAA